MSRTMPPRACARVLDRLADCAFDLSDWTRAARIKVKITVDRERREATVDFTGTSDQRADNFNAPEPVTRAAVLYVFRVMVEDDIPDECRMPGPIEIIIPEGSMLTPRYPAAVVAGNVEVEPGRHQLPVRRARRAGAPRRAR